MTCAFYIFAKDYRPSQAAKILQKMEVDFRKPVKNTCLVEGEYLCTHSITGKDYKIERRAAGEDTERKRESDTRADIV